MHGPTRPQTSPSLSATKMVQTQDVNNGKGGFHFSISPNKNHLTLEEGKSGNSVPSKIIRIAYEIPMGPQKNNKQKTDLQKMGTLLPHSSTKTVAFFFSPSSTRRHFARQKKGEVVLALPSCPLTWNLTNLDDSPLKGPFLRWVP